MPAPVAPVPVKRRLPALRHDLVPPKRAPQRGPTVAVVFDEGTELPVGDRMRSERMRRQQHAMPRPFVVEREPRIGVPGLGHAARMRNPCTGPRADRHQRPFRAVDRRERIAREEVLHVGDDQLLVLLLVLQPELHERGQFVGLST
jgi:hypothetical protein